MPNAKKLPICGLHVAEDGFIDICEASADGGRVERREKFDPFIWVSSEAKIPNFNSHEIPLEGPDFARLDKLAVFSNRKTADSWFKDRDKSLPVERVSSLENQWLLSRSERMFDGLSFSELRRLQLDIETKSSSGKFSNPSIPGDRIIAVGLSGWGGEKILEISEFSDPAERELLEKLSDEILSRNPDVIEGHNIFRFDLDYIRTRSGMLGAKMRWGRFGRECVFRKSRLNVAERTLEYLRCDVPGRTVADTLIMLQLYDISRRALESYSLKSAALHFGISKREERTYIRGDSIGDAFVSDRETFRKYLEDDLRETRGLSYMLLPTYFAQVKNFPMTFQECLLRGSGAKVESLFLEKYFAAGAALPCPGENRFFEGAISRSFRSGIFRKVLHYDVASLYPSIMLLLGECPKNDYLKVFLRELSSLRDYRLKYKKLAREAADENLRSEYSARQASFKILINSFYGYLGLNGAVFGDSGLAEKVTSKGREILSKLMREFERANCEILEADTDGIYVSSPEYFGSPLDLLAKVSEGLPKGIDLEFDGKYPSMLCYKAKNYALLKEDGGVSITGSAFKNRSQEPFLRELTESFIYWKLGVSRSDFFELLCDTEEKIADGKFDAAKLAKSEFLSRSPEVYEREVASEGKGRRAAFEAALMMNPHPSMGEQVNYYIVFSDKKVPDWRRARPLSLADSSHPYDPGYYLKKLRDWRERFSELDESLAPSSAQSEKKENPYQGELF